ncbi:hypothetical protein C2I36_14750 [Rhodobacteraceae bacterium WD3A24]|nr:hypothetical protein C2I36_14750 [Rhodobacteraceae bacterium WD3A24]
MSELIIHIGSHKTGTSSIQQACLSAEEHLMHHGVALLRHGPAANALVRVQGRRADFRPFIATGLADDLLRPRAPRNLLSAECLFWLFEPEQLAPLADLARARFETVSVIAYLRRQDLLAVSHRKQVLHGAQAARFYGVRATPLPDNQPYLQRYFDYATKLADLWGGAFGIENVHPAVYEAGRLRDGDVVEDFAARLGLDLSMRTPGRRNVALSGNRLLVGLKLAELGAPAELRKRIFRHLPEEGRFLPSRAEARAFLSAFEASNDRLNRLFATSARPLRFDDSFDMYPETTNTEWDNERAEQLVDAVMRGVCAHYRKVEGPQKPLRGRAVRRIASRISGLIRGAR